MLTTQTKNYDAIYSIEELQSFADRLISEGDVTAIDIETGYHGPDVKKGALRSETSLLAGISFTNSTEWARYVPLAHDLADNVDNIKAAEIFWNLFHSVPIVAHNFGFELRNLSRWFRKLLSEHPLLGNAVKASSGYFPYYSDTMIESYVRAETQFHGLKYLTEHLFDHKMIQILELFDNLPKTKEKMIRFNTLDLTPKVIQYACEDSVWCLALHKRNYEEVKNRMIFKVELYLVGMLCDMEDFGLYLDWQLINDKAEEAKQFLAELDDEIMADFSRELGTEVKINLNAPAQVADLLFNRMGIEATRFTKTSVKKEKEGLGTKKPSADKTALAKIAKSNPIVKKIVVWKAIKTLLSRYLEKTDKEFRYAPDNKAHPNHIQAALPAGRFAVTDPPYQQWPKVYNYTLDSGTKFELVFRDTVWSPPQHYLLGFDLSMAELRVIAGEAQEPKLLNAFANDIDAHLATAASILGKPISDITEEERTKYGKVPNFSLLYGLMAMSLAERYDLPLEEAEEIHSQFFAGYSRIASYIVTQKADAKKNGYVISKFGRLQPIWEFQSDNWKIRQKGERIGVNGPIQGGVADYMKTAMVRADKALKAAGLDDKVHLVMNIHDALEYYVHESLTPEDVIKVLLPAVNFPVNGWPAMKPDWHAGERWGSVKKLVVLPDGSVKYADELVDESPDFTEEELEAGVAAAVDDKVLIPTTSINILIDYMPNADQLSQLKRLMSDNPGNKSVVLTTPQGAVTLKMKSGSLPSYAIRDIFEGASIS